MNSITTYSYTHADLKKLPFRPDESNKGTFGRVLCACGSYGMAGAAYFAAKAALRSGAGLVEVLTVKENLPVIQTLLPEAIVTVYDKDVIDDGLISNALSRADVIVCGCGLGVSSTSRKLLSRILRESSVPTVLDADALNLLSKNPSLMKYTRGCIITPHPGEMSRLTGLSVDDILGDRINVCRDLARTRELICVLKTHSTTVSDGSDTVFVNTSGNNGMATAGSGDVLAGIIGGLLAQNGQSRLTRTEIAALGVYVHGLAGDAAAEKLGKRSLIASDIIDALPLILK